MVKLDRDDRRNLIRLLTDMAQFADRQQRQVLLIDAGLDDLVAHMNLSVPSPSSAASEIVNYLARYGRVDEEREALGLLLSWIVEESLVGIEQRRYLTTMIERYQMLGQGSQSGQAGTAAAHDNRQPGAAVSYSTPDPSSRPGTAAAGTVGLDADQRAQLLGVLNGIAFTLDNLEELCFLLNIDRESLRHDTKPHLAMDLIRYCESLSMIDRLVSAVRKARPNVALDLFIESTTDRQTPPGPGSRSGMENSEPASVQSGNAAVHGSPARQESTENQPKQTVTVPGQSKPAVVPTRPRFNPDFFYLPDEPLLGFVEIPAGPFLMGSIKKPLDPWADPWASDAELPQHTVDLPSFLIARYPVTVAQFRAFAGGSGFTPGNERSLSGKPDHPVVWVAWKEALAYCDWLEGVLRAHPLAERLRARLGTDLRATLPSEAEWEKAARSADGRYYPWGDTFDSQKANTFGNGIGTTSPVGSYPDGASPYGVLDMSGNVWEWTRSLWGRNSTRPDWKYPYDPGDRRREDLSAGDQTYRVLRGGSWRDHGGVARCASRNGDYPNYSYLYFGFRVVVLPSSSDKSGL